MLDKVKFEQNIPQSVTLRHPAGKIVTGRFGDQVYYSLEGGQCMYLDLDVAQKINMLEPQPGENVVICKRNSKIWDVWLSPETEKMRAAKERPSLEADLRASLADVNQKRYATLTVPVGNGYHDAAPAPAPAAAPTPEVPAWAAGLVSQTNALVDAYAACLSYANRHGNQVKPEDVRSMLVTAYINQSKGAR